MSRLALLSLCLLLAACQLKPATEDAPLQSAAPDADGLTQAHQTALDPALPEVNDNATAETPKPTKAQPPKEPPKPAAEPPKPALPAALQPIAKSCEKSGGTLAPRPKSGLYTCVKPTRDANKRCTQARDCQGVCLARSGTCAPADPMLGCNEVLGDRGVRSTVCLQ